MSKESRRSKAIALSVLSALVLAGFGVLTSGKTAPTEERGRQARVRVFSKKFASFEDWLRAQPLPYTSYAKTIMRLHGFYPKATLRQLRRHPTKWETPLGKLKRRKVWQLDWMALTSPEKERRMSALRALSLMRRKKVSSLHRASQLAEIMLPVKTIINNAASAFIKVRKKWHPKKYDKISRKMAINENGREIYITINNSRIATMVGDYHNAVKRFLHTGNTSFLKPFKGKTIKDSMGKLHWFDVNPNHLYEIWEAKEAEEFFSIYSS